MSEAAAALQPDSDPNSAVSQLVDLLSDPEHHAWLQNMQTAYVRGELHRTAFHSIEEFDAFVASELS